MGKHIEFDSEASMEKIKTAGVNKNTQKAQRLAEQHFLDFVKEKLGDKHEDIFTEASIMEDILIQYFDTYRLNDGQLPSKSTLWTSTLFLVLTRSGRSFNAGLK